MRNVNYQSLFTSILTSSNVLHDAPMSVVDVGARGGPQPHWPLYAKNVRVIGFEPYVTECERLNNIAPQFHVPFTCYPLGLSNKNSSARLYEYEHNQAANSLLPPPDVLNPRFTDIELVRFDDFAAKHKIDNVDFVKIDIEKHELEALEGMRSFLVSEKPILGLEIEVRFWPYSHKPLLSEIEIYLRQFGYCLVDIDIFKQSDPVLPSPVAWDHRNQLNEPILGPTVTGRLDFADALFMLDPSGLNERPALLKDTMKMLKLASLYEMYGLPDIAANLLLRYSSLFEPILKPDYTIKNCLDVMVPPYFGKGLKYDQYLDTYIKRIGRVDTQIGG